METIINNIGEIGILAAILLLFVKYFLDSNKGFVLQNKELYNQFVTDSAQREEQFRADIKRREKEYRSRENILVAESARREEILKQESEKREQIIKTEASKREATLLTTIEGFSATMREISVTMNDIKQTTRIMESKIGGIENVLQDYKMDIRSDEGGEKDGS